MSTFTVQGHPTDLFLTTSVLQRKFCWLGTEVSAVLLGSKVLNLRSRIYQMYQKFLLEVFYPSNLLEIFLGCISSWVSGVIGSSQVAPAQSLGALGSVNPGLQTSRGQRGKRERLGTRLRWLLFVRELCALSRALIIYLPLIKKSARGHRCYLLEIRNQATLRHWITGNGSLAVRTIHEIHVYAKGKVSLNILNILSTIMHACYF